MAAKKNEEEVRFSKTVLLASSRYKDSRDLVAALLDNGREYTISEVDDEIQKYLKKEVN